MCNVRHALFYFTVSLSVLSTVFLITLLQIESEVASLVESWQAQSSVPFQALDEVYMQRVSRQWQELKTDQEEKKRKRVSSDVACDRCLGLSRRGSPQAGHDSLVMPCILVHCTRYCRRASNNVPLWP